MSFWMFTQKCDDCGATWTATGGMVGTTWIGQQAKECPKCHSENLSVEKADQP